MAMGWLKGLVAPAAFPDNPQHAPPGMAPQGPPGGAPQGGPPLGGSPSPYGVQPGMAPPAGGGGLPGAPMQGQPPPSAAYDNQGAMQWSVGTKPQGGVGHALATGGGAAGGGLEARCAQLQHEVDSLALFARTLLTMLEDNKVVSREQFLATKERLDLLDGKLDDR